MPTIVIKNIFDAFAAWLKKLPLWFILFFIFYFATDGFKPEYQKWYYIHHTWMAFLCGLLISACLGVRNRNIFFIVALLCGKTMEESEFFSTFSQWLFFSSPIEHWFDRLAVKDNNVGTFLLLLLFWLLLSMRLFLTKLRRKSRYLNGVFVWLITAVIIGTTAIFHTYVIHKNMAQEAAHLLDDMELMAASLKEEPGGLKAQQEFCASLGYECFNPYMLNKTPWDKYPANTQVGHLLRQSYNKTADKISTSESLNQQLSVNNFYKVRATYPVEGGRHVAFVYHKNTDSWVIDDLRYHAIFESAQELFMSLCVWAHGFWLLFGLFLVSFHYREKA